MGERTSGADNVHADREQIQAVERYARNHGARVEFLPPELSVSGGKPIADRPSLLAAIEGVEAGRYQGIVVAYLSRLTRSRSGLEIWDRVEAAGGSVHCAAENLDTSTANGRFVRDIHLANAVREREEHVDRFALRAQVATEAGVWQRRVIPTGYQKDPATRRLTPDERAGDVLRAFQDRAAGRPILDISQQLGMTTSGVRHLLQNRVYLGELRVRSYVNATAHPAIVPLELFEQAQAARRTRRARSGRAPALLAGLVRCAGCGHVMSRTSAGKNRDVYGCSIHKSAGRCPQPASVTLRLLDDMMSGLVVQELHAVRVRSGRDTGRLDELRAEQAAAHRDLAVFLDVTASAGLDTGTLAEGVRQRQERIALIDQAVTAAVGEQALPVVDDPQGLWDELGVGERAQLLRGLVEAVIVRKVGRGGHVVPVVERTRVIRHGSGLFSPKAGAERAAPILGVWPDLNDERVVRVTGG